MKNLAKTIEGYAIWGCIALFVAVPLVLTGCEADQQPVESEVVERQQAQYSKGQPVPVFDWSLERQQVIELYRIRNERVATHSVWRSDYGMVEGDCPSIGYGLPYDVSLTNPWVGDYLYNGAAVAIGQPEPNGVFASQNTAATWVMCVGTGGTLEPHYVESKVTVYPGPVEVDYATNRVRRVGDATVRVRVEQ